MSNPITQRNRTMGEIMADLRARLGFVNQGSASRNNDAVMKSFLREAHEFVYGELEPPVRRKKCEIQVQANSFLYDWNNDAEDQPIDPGRVIGLWVLVNTDIREPLRQGITEQDRSFDNIREQPQKYDTLNGQIELWPVPDRDYTIIVEYNEGLPRFERTSDRPGVPDMLVFLYALANAKAHYRHPDAQAAATTFQRMLSKEKERQRENRRYFVEPMQERGAAQVVRTANGGYTLRS